MRQPILRLIKVIERLPVVFTLSSFAAAIGKHKNSTAVYLKKLVDNNIIYRIGKGLYSKVKDPVVVAGNLPYPSYITGRFALFYWGKGEAPSIIDVTTVEYKKGYKEWPIKFHIVKELGKFTIAKYAGYNIKIATLEQAERDLKRFFVKSSSTNMKKFCKHR